ncbi:bacteriophage lambda NinG family protein [Pseudomonas chlororaphis]|uniref:recombination protein NinG n=1 Tax=Pseudomonas chlororaphis TaxID=587753 RepID=UPI0004AC0FE8|nr:recombination protein NinG [Pseudomonas chlororaphis]AIC20596.1 bacteriophage lambda NinG family protein [Pseudomonas chlororaphis]
MKAPIKQRRQKECGNPACGVKFTPVQLGQKVCGWACGLAIKDVNQEKARKAIQQRERREIKVRKERIKTRGDHFRETQTVFNEWVRLRDAALPCVSCGRHHEGQYHAGHYRTVGANPELRFEPLNVHKQCAPCNNHKSGDIVNYRIELVKRIGAEMVEWLEGPHSARKYTADELKALKAKYRELIKELKRTAA